MLRFNTLLCWLVHVDESIAIAVEIGMSTCKKVDQKFDEQICPASNIPCAVSFKGKLMQDTQGAIWDEYGTSMGRLRPLWDCAFNSIKLSLLEVQTVYYHCFSHRHKF